MPPEDLKIHETNHTETRAVTSETDRPRAFMTVAIIMIIIALAAVGIYYAWKKRGDTKPATTAEDIRNTFTPATGTTPTFTPPAPSDGYGSSGSPTNPPAAANPPPPSDTNNPPPVAQPPVTAGPVQYQNNALNFSMAIPASWVAQPSGNNSVYFFEQSTGRQQGYVEAYAGGGATIDELEDILNKSSSVTSTARATVAGLPAIKFTAADVSQSGLALISNGTIYYIRGPLPGAAGTFQPLAAGAANNPAPQNSYSPPTGGTYY